MSPSGKDSFGGNPPRKYVRKRNSGKNQQAVKEIKTNRQKEKLSAVLKIFESNEQTREDFLRKIVETIDHELRTAKEVSLAGKAEGTCQFSEPKSDSHMRKLADNSSEFENDIYLPILKTANDPFEAEKLVNQIKFLKRSQDSITEERWKEHLPFVIDSCLDPPKYYMKNYGGTHRSLRKAIFKGSVGAPTALKILEHILNFVINDMYHTTMTYSKVDTVQQQYEKYEKRIMESKTRIDRMLGTPNVSTESKHYLRIFKKLIDSEKFFYNGHELENVRSCLYKIKTAKNLAQKLIALHGGTIHDDLHFDNILVNHDKSDPDGFILVDPAGFLDPVDIIYDIAKLYHSVRGRYDFIHKGRFTLEIFEDENGIQVIGKILGEPKFVPSEDDSGGSLAEIFSFENEVDVSAWSTFDCIEKDFPALLNKYDVLQNDENWQLRTELYESMDFCTMIPFHIKEKNKDMKYIRRAIMLYVRGIELLNNFVEKYRKD